MLSSLAMDSTLGGPPLSTRRASQLSSRGIRNQRVAGSMHIPGKDSYYLDHRLRRTHTTQCRALKIEGDSTKEDTRHLTSCFVHGVQRARAPATSVRWLHPANETAMLNILCLAARYRTIAYPPTA